MRSCSRHFRTISSLALLSVLLVLLIRVPQAEFVATDPGPRGGPPGAGGPLPDLSPTELELFRAGQAAIQEIDSVQGTLPDTGLGLGPRFNMDSCGGCHSYPAPGGSSPPVNPLVAVATKAGATNTVPFFISIDGPIRRAFIKHNLDGSPNGSAPHLYTITGRVDAPRCVLTQPDFAALGAADNLAFHIPPPLYGAGLLDAIETTTLVANLASQRALKQSLGIGGHLGGLFDLGRFFWKGQGTGLLVIAAGAYQNEVGVTNALFPTEADAAPQCQFNALPEDPFNFQAATFIDGLPDFVKIAGFVSFSAPPAPSPDTPASAAGRALFARIGCALCHTPSLQTGASLSPALRDKTATLYSDLAVHHMGPGLADGLSQGNAGPDEFRTAPLWGLGQRLFFLHDGRTTDLRRAVEAHASQGGMGSPSSEANAVIDAFNSLSERQKQRLLDFLRGL